MNRRISRIPLTFTNLLALVLTFGLLACSADINGVEQESGEPMVQGDPEPAEGEEFGAYYNVPMNATVKVCNVYYGLNNRSGPGTGYMVLRVLNKGQTAKTVDKSGHWYRLNINGAYGWSYGKYLCAASGSSSPSPSPSPGGSCHQGSKFGWNYCSPGCPCGENEGDCDNDAECKPGLRCVHDVGKSYGTTSTVDVCRKVGGSSSPSPAPSTGSSGINVSQNGIINASKAFVGFSYWWGGARFSLGSKDYGKCYSATYGGHSGPYGADCSGFAGKVWQLPNAMPFDRNLHPYSTWHFYNGTYYWKHISRNDTRKADALVYNTGSSGHIVIYESGNAWGKAWAYEAKGCSYGVVHNLRTVSSSYRARRRSGL